MKRSGMPILAMACLVSRAEADHMGNREVDGKLHSHDLHAAMLRLLGIAHTQLTWNHLGRNFRRTDGHGSAVKEILAQ
jgi:hypothetical protein